MAKKYMNRQTCMSKKAYFVPVAKVYTKYTYGYDESIVEGNGDY